MPSPSNLAARDARHVWHPYTQHHDERAPLPVVAAHGATLVLDDGRAILDATSSWWACVHGHGHPTLKRAMTEQCARLDHVMFAGVTHEPAVALAEALVAAAPAGLERVFYSDNGSSAVEVALKMAYHAFVHAGQPERRVFIALEGSYHGDTFGAMAVGDPDPFFRAYRPLLFEVRHVPARADALAAAIDELGPRVAAVIVEPLLQAAGGMRLHGVDFLRAARALCDSAGIYLIADEVMTGFARTGTLFACDRAGISPDFLCLAKGLTGGMYPLAVTMARAEVFGAFLSPERARFFPHGHTMTANPVGCALGLASLALCRDENVPARLERIGERLRAELVDVALLPWVQDLRQLGGVVAFDLTPPAGDSAGYMAHLGPRLRDIALQHDVLLRPLGNVVYATPPACVTAAEIARIADTMRAMALVARP